MKRLDPLFFLFGLLSAVCLLAETPELPWQAAGLSERQAAAHLLDRFAFGSRPGDVDRIVEKGLDRWLAEQLDGALAEDRLDDRLAGLRSLQLSNEEIAKRYPTPGRVLREAREAGFIAEIPSRESMASGKEGTDDRSEMRRKLVEFARRQDYRSQRELVGELLAQKLYRAVYSENQLTEVLTDFWFNHFNVSLSNNAVRPFVMTYERDAIRPHVLGFFHDMLAATARHPAMLFYLDNARSVAPEGTPTTFSGRSGERRGRRAFFGSTGRRRVPRPRSNDPERTRRIREIAADRRPTGLNENYARELLELHTLGVDGGYTQEDVIVVARAFTGWTAFPPVADRDRLSGRIRLARRLPDAGFVFEDDFIFRADVHDAAPKKTLGRELPGGRGIEDGEDVLAMLATHPSTARHLATKLAVRFVSDEPPATLVDRLTEIYLASHGDLRRVIQSLAEAPEFWSPEARHQKIKSPFELVVSALRIGDADVRNPRQLLDWISRMGQPLYAYQAPTGYPDRAETWVNTGALLHRMNFGLQLAMGRVKGMRFDLAGLNEHREPASAHDALRTYVPLLLPERDPEATIRRLEVMAHEPTLTRKVADRAPTGARPEPLFDDSWEELLFGDTSNEEIPASLDDGTLAQVVGLIFGSPEFQRR